VCTDGALLCTAAGGDIELRDGLLIEVIAEPLGEEVVENWGAGRTSANPDFATW
jgi:hypothetical protein